MNGLTFKLFACCVPVRGARRSTICDVQRRAWRFIPNGLYEILTLHKDRPLFEIKAAYGPEAGAVIDQYFAFLLEQEFGFWCDDPSAFPDVDLTWEVPETISNAIIDVGPGSAHDFVSLVVQLDALGCRALELRVFSAYPLAALDAALCATSRSRLRAVEVLARYGADYDESALRRLARDHPRVSRLTVHSAPGARVLDGTAPATVMYVTQAIDSEAHCGQVHPAYFAPSLGAFAESHAYNSCLNRKLAIDQRGAIRNCPSLPQSFGDAAVTPLRDAVARPDFRRLWGVTKDQVETCRDCEFRYVCTDCRAYVRAAPDGAHGKPAKCAYDPYAARWGDPERAAAPSALGEARRGRALPLAPARVASAAPRGA